MAVDRAFLDQSVSLGGLPDALADEIVKIARVVPLTSGKVLFQAGDPGNGFYSVLDGSLKVSLISAEGLEQLLDVLGPGSVVGELAIFDGRPRSATVTALKESKLAFIDRHSFERVAEEQPAIYRHMLKIVGGRLRHANDVFAARCFLPMNGRIAQTLLQLADTFGKEVDRERILIHYKVSQADLANMSGMARENASRILNIWKRDGLISRISGYYCIEDKQALEAAAAL
ncbi:MAG: Crp/Fnr family transcriptional regulator [Rhodobiaceae bacterium]|nr:Crp/Fnr family transcriptional regulator [Rhodobiaceae bacterium]